MKTLQLCVVYPRTTAKIRTEVALCEGKYSGDIDSFKATIKDVLEREELLALGVRPLIQRVLQGIDIGFGVEKVDYVLIQRLGTFIVRLENTRARSGRTLFIDVTNLHHAATMYEEEKKIESRGRLYRWVVIGMGVLGTATIVVGCRL